LILFDFRRGEACLALEASNEKFSSQHDAISDFLEPSQNDFGISRARKSFKSHSQINSRDAKTLHRNENLDVIFHSRKMFSQNFLARERSVLKFLEIENSLSFTVWIFSDAREFFVRASRDDRSRACCAACAKIRLVKIPSQSCEMVLHCSIEKL
jgi:hypothetical protein